MGKASNLLCTEHRIFLHGCFLTSLLRVKRQVGCKSAEKKMDDLHVPNNMFSKDSDYIQVFQGYVMIEKQDMLFLTKNGVQGKLSEMVKNYVENYPRSNIIPIKFDLG